MEQHKVRGPGHTTWSGKVPLLLLCKEVNITTDHKPLVAMVSKYITTLPQWLQCTVLYIHQYSVHILYNPEPDLYIADWLSCHNNTENKDQEITGMNINIHTLNMAIGILVCTSVEHIRNAMSINVELQMLQTSMTRAWSQNKDDVESTPHTHWPIRHDLAIIDGVAMKGK